ncbi:hypothetical protein [Aporhodopirellula aestuarii]|uniref:Uncharacterized protein n=1 Tax=Aporhodopirellula aestuarii TaxID=2950107 RepID=A0ABT0U5T6_9BACT|nr:hypothetical protein [Aporhodopirellula aestuarii]MCM2371905.1 hypothetical protein [Aporhodopirellula aestuarii]
MVYGSGSDKFIGATDDDEHVAVDPDTPAVEQAIERLNQRLNQIPQA